MELPQTLLESIDQFRKLPGIGEKSATRFALEVVKWKRDSIAEFSSVISKIAEIQNCERCQMYSDSKTCKICDSVERVDTRSICVVEAVTDLVAIERSRTFSGTYFVLNGVLNPLLGVGPQDLKLENLIELVKKEDVHSLILAINPSVEGDATCSYIQSILPSSVTIERIGFGVPMGGSLEYLDSLTIKKALENRRRF